jgi:hypothetical protein
MQPVKKARRVGIPQGRKPIRFARKTLRLMRMGVVRGSSSKSERGKF